MVDDGRTTDGRTTEHGYTISSPCESDGSGELKMNINDGWFDGGLNSLNHNIGGHFGRHLFSLL